MSQIQVNYVPEIIRLRKSIKAALTQLSLQSPNIIEARLELIDGLQPEARELEPATQPQQDQVFAKVSSDSESP